MLILTLLLIIGVPAALFWALIKWLSGGFCDLDTARFLATWNNGSPDESTFVVEDLFKSRGGVYFLECFGGQDTDYSLSSERPRAGYMGRRLFLLSRRQARAWYRKHQHEFGFDEVVELKDI